ncbi:MAG: response regulator transcription factor [Pseudonocardia sp.]|nr:response regulator transcription factor [Pseudonocardia sp.]
MRVLLVEDEERLAQTVRDGLAEQGHRVEVMATGPDGLWAARNRAYDVIVLDIMLPGLSGYRILQALRAAEIWTPVLMLTAKDGEYDEADAFDLGADDYLTKPFSFVVLLARLRALLRRGAPARPAVLTVGELALDPSVRKATCRAGPLPLTPREFGLLEFLMRNAGRALSKTEILDSVWDPHYEGDVNIVEVYVGYLRRKTGLPAGEPGSIETMRGVGYLMLSAASPDGSAVPRGTQTSVTDAIGSPQAP